MKQLILMLALIGLTAPSQAQYLGNYTANPYNPDRVNPYASGGDLYTRDGEYRGRANNNIYDPDSTSNPYGRYGSRYSPDSIHNPYGAGSRYNYDSPTNPYGRGLMVCGRLGCD